MDYLITSDLHTDKRKLCRAGAKLWFEKYNISYERFLAGKVTIEEVKSLNDALGNVVCETAMRRLGK